MKSSLEKIHNLCSTILNFLLSTISFLNEGLMKIIFLCYLKTITEKLPEYVSKKKDFSELIEKNYKPTMHRTDFDNSFKENHI